MPKKLHAIESPEPPIRISEARYQFDEGLRAAFEYGGGEEPRDTQKALHAIAFLMEWATGAGNEQVNPMAFNGLSFLMRKCAEDVGRLYTQDDVRAFGGSIVERAKKAKAGSSPTMARGVCEDAR